MCNPGTPSSWYAVTKLSSMHGPIDLRCIKKFKEFTVKSGLDDGKPHVLLIYRHAPHVLFESLKYVKANEVHLFQLPSHSSHCTQPLGACAFGIFKLHFTDTLTTFPQKNGGCECR